MPLSTKTEINALLQRAGVTAETTAAVMDIDGMLQHWRRRAMKRELGNRALIDLKIDIDLAQLDVLSAIAGPAPEFGDSQGETMVGTVADRLAIDPSRASRLVSEMVDRGFARRAVSQADARRTIIELTAQGEAVVDAVRAYKYLILGDFLGTWSPEDIAAFVPLLKRFSRWTDGIDAVTDRHGPEIDQLVEAIAMAGKVPEEV
ncbi:MarR family protein [Devosia equisanguinis]|uniref:MarR family protein n=1 Tax=Devosia equisanguinis TaxID=2490941 RepID=A0A3S4D6T8_9HYPH|nr:MarR family winged helix-turn-helix transcriptional regulator [Devosia equisanguinis]VDS05764.1 MarR family protein [Devosia equisanguinis]